MFRSYMQKPLKQNSSWLEAQRAHMLPEQNRQGFSVHLGPGLLSAG